MNESIWYKLLDYWCNKKTPLGSGLTIPFLIGAERTRGNRPEYSITNLLEEFSQLDCSTYKVCLRRCGGIGEIVCALEEICEEEKLYYNNINELYYTGLSSEISEDISSLNSFLEEKYASAIHDGYYSIERRVWKEYTKYDIEIIDKACNYGSKND